MAINIWQNNTKTVPMGKDSQIVRVPMDQIDIGGRKDHLPAMQQGNELTISHVPNRG